MKKLLVSGILVLAGLGFFGSFEEDSRPTETVVPATVNQAQQVPVVQSETGSEKTIKATDVEQAKPVEKKIEPTEEKTEPAIKSSVSCSGDYYRNVDGDCVQRPVVAPSEPAAAPAPPASRRG